MLRQTNCVSSRKDGSQCPLGSRDKAVIQRLNRCGLPINSCRTNREVDLDQQGRAPRTHIVVHRSFLCSAIASAPHLPRWIIVFIYFLLPGRGQCWRDPTSFHSRRAAIIEVKGIGAWGESPSARLAMGGPKRLQPRRSHEPLLQSNGTAEGCRWKRKELSKPTRRPVHATRLWEPGWYQFHPGAAVDCSCAHHPILALSCVT